MHTLTRRRSGSSRTLRTAIARSGSSRTLLRTAIVAIAAIIGGSAYSQVNSPDLIIVNAKVYTVDQQFSTAEAVAVAEGRFTAVGTTARLRKLAGPSTTVLDAGGKTVVPGLADDHL